ncbi:hypothetical protein [Mycobacterium uberis]|uniref:hypothetical protein n=1 Tax=Mycobacterium uberis TaxID=2162698 RepID=UPI001A9E2B7F|nr:hypothetical protein [Mycobacterium uberis]
MAVAFRIGSATSDFTVSGSIGMTYNSPEGAVLHYTETSFGGQRAVVKLVASRALDRPPKLKVLVSEGKATWVPFIIDRTEEGYRQHSIVLENKINRGVHEIIYAHMYASFQHD